MASRDVADVDDVNRVNSANVIQDDFEYILGMRVFNFKCSVGIAVLLDDFRIMKQIMIYFAGACADQGARVRVAASLFTVVHGGTIVQKMTTILSEDR